MQVLKTIGEHRAVRRIQAEVLRLATDDDGMSTAEYSTIRNSSHRLFRPDQRVSATPASP